MLSKVLIANRGEIACRIVRTLKQLGIGSVAVYSEADRDSPHVTEADEAFLLGPAPVSESYLRTERLLEIAALTECDGLHPGYGLLSENAGFAEACEAAGIAWIGPTGEQIRQFGLKHTARQIAKDSGVPLLEGTPLLSSVEEALSAAGEIGFPVMLKSTAGGGGIGMEICQDSTGLSEAFNRVTRASQANFGDSGVFLEKYIQRARHVEVQLFGDGKGHVVALGTRDCSAQRRHQKIVEETPAPGFTREEAPELFEGAAKMAAALNYRSAGTAEFLVDADTGDYYFLEINTRLQVEHGITESVTGVDLVEWMVKLAGGDEIDYTFAERGCSIEVRLCAEDPAKDFQPSSGLLTEVIFPEKARVDHWISSGSVISAHYDSLIGKIMVTAPTRDEAIKAMSAALAATNIAGIETNLDYLREIIRGEVFTSPGAMSTNVLADFAYTPSTIDVIASGTQTTVQDYPGRIGYWEVGIPPSGPMDSLSFRIANRLVGNEEGTAGLEIAVSGPTLKFNRATEIALVGAGIPATLDGAEIPFGRPLPVDAGSLLKMGARGSTPGVRAYLAVKGGLDVPDYLGSKSTFTLGQFGGHGGRALRVGDVLRLGNAPAADSTPAPGGLIPTFSTHWDISVIYGPHGCPEFFTPEDIEMVFTTDWKVHYNSARTGVRLIGPKPIWAREDGGEAGLHPSNIHDNAYAVGSIDFTGDMPVILGPDGPSLGGFVCPATVIEADLWKMGQLAPGDTIRFRPVSDHEARLLRDAQELSVKRLIAPGAPEPAEILPIPTQTAIIESLPDVTIRPSGESHLLVEYGEMKLDLNLRFKAHVIYQWFKEQAIEGILDLTPGIRSLQIHFDSRSLSQEEVIELVHQSEAAITDLESVEVPARVVHLPLSWDDPSTQEAIRKYMQSVNPDAPWCPSNIEFIRRINGLDSIEKVKEIVYSAAYCVMGLGDVYLGAPVATPLDPRHRLVTTKYNPARTWTPENAVGIGGAYLCIYGMEGPGGYQFVGRTVQMWNKFHVTKSFTEEEPWLLRFFDQIRFYEVSGEELQQLRSDFLIGRWNPKIEETSFSLRDYNQFLETEADSISAFQRRQQSSFREERQRWEDAGIFKKLVETAEEVSAPPESELPGGCEPVEAAVAGSVWKVLVKPGDTVAADEPVLILEAMKMEITIPSPEAGIVESLFAAEGDAVHPGQLLLALKPS
ncbi:MAG: urea carboxylase [Verrucomicrobiales bacterium]|nr:urea carboxylase [Verrucomicrobiales bacterium]